VDIINKKFDKEKGVLKTTRLILCKSALPKWLATVRYSKIYNKMRFDLIDPIEPNLWSECVIFLFLFLLRCFCCVVLVCKKPNCSLSWRIRSQLQNKTNDSSIQEHFLR
jgi:hypothetical protein